MITDYMTKDLVTVSLDTTILELLHQFTTNRLSGIPVVDDSGKLLGFAPSSKILERILPAYVKHAPASLVALFGNDFQGYIKEKHPTLASKTVREFVVEPSYVLKEDSSFAEAIKIFVERQINRIAVVDAKGQLIGVLCRQNILQALTEALQKTT